MGENLTLSSYLYLFVASIKTQLESNPQKLFYDHEQVGTNLGPTLFI